MFDRFHELTQEYIDHCLSSTVALEEGIIRIISTPNRDDAVTPATPTLRVNERTTIKVERFEHYDREVVEHLNFYAALYNHSGPITAHVFESPKNGFTFDEHTDPDDVIIHCVSGVKTMSVNGREIRLHPGQHFYIKANTPHRAINDEASVMVSIGLEKWMKEKL